MILLLFACVIMYIIANFNYLLFHSLAEGFAIIVAALIYVLATRTYKHSKNDVFLFLGISYFYVAILDFAHMITYKGMGIFPGFDTDVPTQLWIAGRFVEAVSLLMVLFLQEKEVNRKLITTIYAFVTGSLLLSIMVFRVFPICFIEGAGLTPFKIISEYIIICILLASAYVMFSHKGFVKRGIYKTVGLAVLATASSELAFTLYTDVYGIANMLGHMLKVVSYYLIYAGVMTQGIEKPYSFMSSQLQERALKDMLTNLYNRQGMVELIEKELLKVEEEKNSLGILMIDLDNFKQINDVYGHMFGDEVLKEFANLLGDSIREKDMACRFGGDEFVILMQNVGADDLDLARQRIQLKVETWIASNARLKGLGTSIGKALLQPGQALDAYSLLKKADRSMYIEKQSKKGA
ncbi:MAG: GGDEF domain-containing protein [Bacillota bacterium]